MSNDLKFALELRLKNSAFKVGLKESDNAVARFSQGARRELDALKKTMSGVGGAIAGVGVTVGATAEVVQSAKLTKQLRVIELSAGATADQGVRLRRALFEMSKETGQAIPDLVEGFNDLVASGLSWEKSLSTIRAINPAMAVTGASARALASSMTVAAQAFGFDLSNVKTGKQLLDQMTVAGRIGNAELESLSSIFSVVGVNAKAANLGFSETLGLIEQLSLVEKSPERLSTLVDSTLRLFTNQAYKKAAAAATGVRFYDAKGDQRAALDVLQDIAKKYKELPTQLKKDQAIQAAFGNADQDTIKGLRVLLSGDALSGVKGSAQRIENAGGTVAKDLAGALNNSVDQVARLKAALREAADEFAKPINDVLGGSIKRLLDSKQSGGFGLTGGQLAGGVVGAGALGYAASRVASLSLRGVASTAGGLAMGKALEETAGVQSVFVVNMPGGGMGGSDALSGAVGAGAAGVAAKVRTPGKLALLRAAPSLATIGEMGAGAVATSAALVAGAGAAGYGVGTLAHKAIEGSGASNSIGRAVAQAMAALGSKNAQESLASERNALAAERMERAASTLERAESKVKLEITSSDKVSVREIGATPGARIDVDRGWAMQG